MRHDIRFRSGEETCAAWLYVPESGTPAPVIVMAHGLGAVRTMGLDAFAERFCDAGYACLVFDYRYFGDSSGEPRQLLKISSQLEDWKNAVKCAQNEPRVDGSNVIVWGSSFSGGHVLRTAATVPGIAGVMSQCPFTNGVASALALHPVSSIRVSCLAILDVLTMPFRKTPVMVNLAGHPGDAALMSAHDVMEGYNRLKPEGSNIPGYVAARFSFMIPTYFPGASAARIDAPTLLIACLKDTVAPVRPTLRYGRKLEKGEVVELDAGHFDIYVGEWFEKNVALQLDWLGRNFPVKG
ncbi:MAG: alpha/beta fold hydrolase [Thermodesulfobacteriota bacterium]|nr:alpha/beta fold hydrolase [Thermodesulfobacteriota bacterium]